MQKEAVTCSTCRHSFLKYIQWLDEDVCFCAEENLRRKCFSGIPTKRTWTFKSWESKQGTLF